MTSRSDSPLDSSASVQRPIIILYMLLPALYMHSSADCTWTPLPLRYCSTHVIALTYPFYHVFTARSTSADKLQRLSIYCVQLHDVFRCMLFSISLGLCAKMWNIKDRPCTAEKGCNVCSVNGVLKKLKSATTSHRTGSGRLHTDSMEANTEGVGELVLSQE